LDWVCGVGCLCVCGQRLCGWMALDGGCVGGWMGAICTLLGP
jgi:hypothetical protein